MKIPKLRSIDRSTTAVDTFYGYNHNPRIGAGEFYQEENLSSDLFPLLSVREKRFSRFGSTEDITGLVWLDGLWITTGSVIYRPDSDQAYELGLSEGKKKLIPFGAYIIILPDKKYFNTKSPEDRGSIEQQVLLKTSRMVYISMVSTEGKSLSPVSSDTEPADALQWLDTSVEPPLLKLRVEDQWVETPYFTRLSLLNYRMGEPFSKGQTVRLRCPALEAQFPQLFTGACTVMEADASSLILNCQVTKSGVAYTGDSFEITSSMPLMDFVFEHNNRLWGCRYGRNLDGDFVNEIYASKLGEFKVWGAFEGLSTDSFTLRCGTDGPWTGAMEVAGYPTFWKEHVLHKVYGEYPAQFSCAPVECCGVGSGCAESMAMVDGVLYYQGTFGICRYDGSLPREISQAFGGERFFHGVAGALGKKYYLSFPEAAFVYDTLRGIWHRESPLKAVGFAAGGGELYYITDKARTVGLINNLQGTVDVGHDGLNATFPAEEQVPWCAVTGILAEGGQRLQQLELRLWLEPGARLRVSAEYDSSGIWEPLAAQLYGKGTFRLPLRPRPCEHLRLKLEGQGAARLYRLSYHTEGRDKE